MPYSVTLHCSLDQSDLLLAECSEFSTTGIEQIDDTLIVHFEALEEAGHFAKEFARYAPQLKEIEVRNWAEDWQAMWRPIEVGRRFYLSPPWMHDPVPQGRIRLEMRPGLVFGGGDHATTQLCLELLENHLRPGATMADIGCGSGILTDAAHSLGAGTLIACDIDWNAAEAASRILAASTRPALAYCGSVNALRSASVDLIAANLLTGVVVGLLPEFARVLRPGGILVASGFLETQQDLINDKARQQRFALCQQDARSDWAASAWMLP